MVKILPVLKRNVDPAVTMNNATTGGTRADGESPSVLLQRLNEENAELLAPVIAFVLFLMLLGTVGNPVAIYIYGWKWHNTTSRYSDIFAAFLHAITANGHWLKMASIHLIRA